MDSYLASLNKYRKRSRSVEDVGSPLAKAKVAKVDEWLNGYSVDEGAIVLPDDCSRCWRWRILWFMVCPLPSYPLQGHLTRHVMI